MIDYERGGAARKIRIATQNMSGKWKCKQPFAELRIYSSREVTVKLN